MCWPKTSALPRESLHSMGCFGTFAAAGNTRINKLGLGAASFRGLFQIHSPSHRRSSVRCAGKHNSGCAPVHGTWLVFVKSDLTFAIPYGDVRSVTTLFKYDDGQSVFCMAIDFGVAIRDASHRRKQRGEDADLAHARFHGYPARPPSETSIVSPGNVRYGS